MEMSPTKRLNTRRQTAAAAGNKSTTSLSLFMAAYGFEVEEELSTMATQYWTERRKRSVDEANSRSSDVETGERICRSDDV